jgi:hypothetical protein
MRVDFVNHRELEMESKSVIASEIRLTDWSSYRVCVGRESSRIYACPQRTWLYSDRETRKSRTLTCHESEKGARPTRHTHVLEAGYPGRKGSEDAHTERSSTNHFRRSDR